MRIMAFKKIKNQNFLYGENPAFNFFIWRWFIYLFIFDIIMTFLNSHVSFYVWQKQCHHFKSPLWVHYFLIIHL
jgi:hypothetical protein